MIAQLSTSAATTQLAIVRRTLSVGWGLFLVLLLTSFGTPVWAQGSEIERRIAPLSPIDLKFMDDQRQAVERLANRMGRSLTGRADRDVDTLQQILDRNYVPADDELTLQAMGIVFGDLLGRELSMNWVVYRDRAGRSRALRYRDSDTYLFPVTMISRRVAAGSERPLADIYAATVDKTRRQLPGARWLN
jgi:hypothetical protein